MVNSVAQQDALNLPSFARLSISQAECGGRGPKQKILNWPTICDVALLLAPASTALHRIIHEAKRKRLVEARAHRSLR